MQLRPRIYSRPIFFIPTGVIAYPLGLKEFNDPPKECNPWSQNYFDAPATCP